MSELAPTTYTQIAFVIFLAVAAAIVVYVFSRRNRSMFETARSMPLEDAPLAQPAGDAPKHATQGAD